MTSVSNKSDGVKVRKIGQATTFPEPQRCDYCDCLIEPGCTCQTSELIGICCARCYRADAPNSETLQA